MNLMDKVHAGVMAGKSVPLFKAGDTLRVHVKVVEGDYYFPYASLKHEFFVPSATRSTSPREGEAWYYDIVVGGSVNKDAAWYYPQPIRVPEISGYVAFWKGIMVTE